MQGVYYRQSTKEKALELGISGIVKNLPNGNVQILATGTDDQLDQLVQWCNDSCLDVSCFYAFIPHRHNKLPGKAILN